MKNTKKLVLLLALVCVFVLSLVLAACGEDQTATYSVTVNKGTGVDIDLSTLTAQWKSGNDVKGSAKLDADGKASVDLALGSYTVVLSGDGIDSYEYTAANATATNTSVSITLNVKQSQPDTATYSITVTGGESDLDYTGITAVWKQGTETKASKALAADGTASTTLEKGSYTVTLTGDALDAYIFSEASVTATKTSETITLTKKGPATVSYTVKVTTNDSELDLTGIAVQWKTDSTTVAGSAVLNANGEASTMLSEGSYTVTLLISTNPSYYTFADATVTADDTHADITLTAIKRDVAVTITSPVALPSDVKVKVLVNDEQYGELASIANDSATVTVPFTGDFSVELVHTYDYFTAAAANGSSSDKTVAIAVSLSEIDYRVNVYAPAVLNLSTITLTLLDGEGTPVAGATNLAITGSADKYVEVSVLAGSYTVQINGLSEDDYSYTADELTIDNRTASVNITANFVLLDLSTDPGAYVVLDGKAPVLVKLASEVKIGTQYALTLNSAAQQIESDDDYDYFTNGIYTVAYNGKNYVYNAEDFATKQEWRNVDWNMQLITFDADHTSLTINATLPNEADQLYVYMTLVELSNEELIPLVIELEVGVTKENEELVGYSNQWQYVFTAQAFGNYAIEIVGVDAATSIAVNNGEPLTGVEGNGKITFAFLESVLPNDTFEISITNMTHGTITYSVTIVMLPIECGDFVLGVEKSLALTGDNVSSNPDANKTLTFVVPVTGVYKLSVDGMIMDVFGPYQVVTIKDTTGSIELIPENNTIGSTNSVTFMATKDASITFKFTKSVGENYNVNLTMVITLEEIKEEVLSPIQSVSAKVGTSLDNASEIKLDPENVTVGKEYMIFVAHTAGIGQTPELILHYNDQDVSIPILPSEAGRAGYEVKFTVVEGQYSLWIYNTHLSAVQPTTVSLSEVKDTLAFTGVGQSVTATIVEGEENAIVIELSGLSHGTPYVITVNTFTMWIGLLKLKYGAATTSFANVGDWENSKAEFTYVEDDFLDGPNVIKIYIDNNENLSLQDVTITITAK